MNLSPTQQDALVAAAEVHYRGLRMIAHKRERFADQPDLLPVPGLEYLSTGFPYEPSTVRGIDVPGLQWRTLRKLESLGLLEFRERPAGAWYNITKKGLRLAKQLA